MTGTFPWLITDIDEPMCRLFPWEVCNLVVAEGMPYVEDYPGGPDMTPFPGHDRDVGRWPATAADAQVSGPGGRLAAHVRSGSRDKRPQHAEV